MKTRVISAIIAVALIVAITYFFKTDGLIAICSLVGLGAIYEFSRLAFRRFDTPRHLQATFIAVTAALFFTTFAAHDEAYAIGVAAVGSVAFLAMSLLTVRSSEDLPIVLQLQCQGILGLAYCGIFPGLVVKLIMIERSGLWLFGLLGIVFAGDTFAYLAGRAFGRHKLLEPVSPKKTIEGAIGGLLGSALAGAILGLFFVPSQSVWLLVFTALVTGAFAQVGDLFESLLKRVADVKDSGRIMPGHGGILDRIDGVLFAAPVYFVLIRFLI